MTRVLAANNAMANVAAAFPESVLFNLDVANASFTSEQISPLDCFHPSIDGLNLIADKTWQLSE